MTRTRPPSWPAPSAASGSSSSSSGRTSEATRGGTRGCASSPRRWAWRPSSPATRTRTTLAVQRSRTRWSRSGTAPRSRAPSGSGAAITSRCCSRPSRLAERFPTDAEAVARTGELAARLEFDLTAGARLPLPGLLRPRRARDRRARPRLQPGIRGPLRQTRTAHKRKARARLDEELALIDELGPRRVLPAALGGARARRRRRARGARPRVAAPLAAAGPRPGQLGRLARLLPDRALARRPGRRRALARAVPEPGARVGPRHRPRLPARHPREADRRAHRALRARARRARRELLDLPLARGDPRPRQGARPAVRRARAARAHHRGEPEARRRGDRASFPTARRSSARLAGGRSPSCRARSPASRATSRSTRAAWSSRAGRSWSSFRCSPRPWKGARSASGTRTRAPTRAS